MLTLLVTALLQPEADFSVAPVFTDHMVIQRDRPVPVWGTASPGESLTLRFDGQTVTATADASGKWTTKLAPHAFGGPFELTVKGKGTRTIRDILVGDVWICSGQSNMEMGIGAVLNAQQEIAAATYPNIRLMMVGRNIQYAPATGPTGTWMACTPETIAANGWSGFTAVGYFFGRELYKSLNVPIGLIQSCWGGTVAEAWTSASGLAKLKDFDAQIDQVRATAARADNRNTKYSEQLNAWFAKYDRGTTEHFERTEFDDSTWTTMSQPQEWATTALKEFDGCAWFRTTVEVPADAAGKAATLNLGPIDDGDLTFVNGQPVGRTEQWDKLRAYAIPAGTLVAGRNVVAIRILDTGQAGGMYGKADQLSLDINGTKISLAQDWRYTITLDFKSTPPPPQDLADNPNVATVLFNGMIHPLVPFGIKGAIWYQGESNAGRAAQYRALLPALIQDWRQQFQVRDFPFYIVSLANFQAAATVPGDDAWAELREAQALTARNVRNSGQAIAIDIGDAKDIHPKNKQEVGRRLALVALNKTYKMNVACEGPTYRGMTIEENRIRLTFDHLEGGFVVDGSALEGFAIAGPNRKFVWADAWTEGNTIVVASRQVPNPVAVRYAWSINPRATLYNKAMLPAVPFRTDDWPLSTGGRK